MDKKIKECFTPHVVMHSLFALGLGITLITLLPALSNLWLGIGLMVAGVVWDSMRK